MNVDLPSFEQQLSASQSVQTRLQTLTSNVENLSRAHSDMISTLIQALMPYAALARKSIHANVAYDALVHLSRCRNELLALSALVEEGKLPDAVSACGSLDKSLLETPSHLSQAGVVVDLKVYILLCVVIIHSTVLMSMHSANFA
jgi:centromere/kinetochore protein ZW10